MPHVMLSWPDALIIAACLVIVAALSRVPRVARTWTGWGLWGGVAWEAALLSGLYGLWMFAGSFTVMSPAGAVPRARWLWHAERLLYLPSETSVQRLFLPHPLLIQAFNLYYDILHFPVLGACLVWLDGIAAGLLVATVLAAQLLVRQLRSGKSSESAQVTSVNREMSVRS
jgi:PAP2 superfamily